MSKRVVFYCLFFLMSISKLGIAKTTQWIPPVIVNANKITTDTATSTVKKIITANEMQTSGATSLAEALQELGNVELQDSTGNGSQVALSLRGFGNNAFSNTLLLVNGIPLTNPDLAPPDLNAIPLQEIAYIEIIAGSEGVLYGDQAVGGVINIITKNDAAKKIALSCNAGSYNQRDCFATWNNQFKQFTYGIDLATHHTDNYRNHNNYGQNLIAGRINYLYSQGLLGFDFRQANEKMLYPGGLTREEVKKNRRQANNDTDFFNDTNGFYHVRNEHHLNQRWQVITDITLRNMQGNGVLTSAFTQSRHSDFFQPELKGTFKNTLMTTGIALKEDQYDLTSLFGKTADNQQQYDAFLVADQTLTERWSISLGARYAEQKNQLQSFTNNNTTSSAKASTIGTTVQINPKIKWYLRRAGSFRFPKADEDASSPDGLKTQTGVSYETGLTAHYQKLYMNFSLYQLNLKNEITFDPTQTPTDPFGTNTNLAPTVRHGLSFAFKKILTSSLTLDGQYNYVNAEFQTGINAGKRIPMVSENIFHGGINYKINSYWNIYSEAIYTGNQYADNDNANAGEKFGGYTRVNVNLRYHFQKFSAAFRINNIFNKYYYYYTVLNTSTNTDTFYPAPGRSFLLTFKYLFI